MTINVKVSYSHLFFFWYVSIAGGSTKKQGSVGTQRVRVYSKWCFWRLKYYLNPECARWLLCLLLISAAENVPLGDCHLFQGIMSCAAHTYLPIMDVFLIFIMFSQPDHLEVGQGHKKMQWSLLTSPQHTEVTGWGPSTQAHPLHWGSCTGSCPAEAALAALTSPTSTAL